MSRIWFDSRTGSMLLKVIYVGWEGIVFSDGSTLSSFHFQECHEEHFLDFCRLKIQDFDGRVFDLSGEFWLPVPGMGIWLMPYMVGSPVPVHGEGINNGYFGDGLSLVLTRPDGSVQTWDVTECQSAMSDMW